MLFINMRFFFYISFRYAIQFAIASWLALAHKNIACADFTG